MKHLFASVILSASLLWGSAGVVTAKEKVRIGVSNWPTIQAMASIIREIADTELGLDAEVVNSTTPVILASMDRGKQDIDIHPEIWMPNHASLVKEYVEDRKTVILADSAYQVRQGICIPRSLQDAHNIRSVYDLARPEIAAFFQSESGEKGKFWIGPPGWSSSKTETVRARDYGYGQFFELSTVEENLALVDLEQALRSDKPWAGYCYLPHHVFSRSEVVMLDEPPYDAAKWKMVQPDENPDWFALSKIETAWPPVDIHIAYSKSLAERLPSLVTLLRNLKVSTEEVGKWTYALAVEKQAPNEFAAKWVAEHKPEVEQWLFK